MGRNNSSDEESTSEDEDTTFVDTETHNQEQITEFSRRVILSEEAVSLKDVYVLNLANNTLFDKIAVGISDGTVELFDLTPTGLNRCMNAIPAVADKSTISGVNFQKNDPNVLFVGTTDGSLALFDLRTGKKFTLETNDSGERKRPITCLDVNSNGRILCAGTEQIVKDVYLLFFDIRGKKLLGGYWESHQDDITTLKFHSSNPDLLISGSTDGLINIFDIIESSEDDALKTVINTESSVARIQWHKNVYGKDILSCITHVHDFKLYEADEGDLISEFSRSSINGAMKRNTVDDCYLANCHTYDEYGTQFLLAGSNNNKGKILRGLKIQQKSLYPLTNYEQNKQIVRDSLYNAKENILITSGESAIVSVWSSENFVQPITSNNYKTKSKPVGKLHGKKPY